MANHSTPRPENFDSPADAAASLESLSRDAAGVAQLAERMCQLVETHHAPLYRYAYRLTGCVAEAEDITQQTFLLAQERIHQLREEDRAAAWLFAVLRSCFLKSVRRKRPQVGAGELLEKTAEQENSRSIDPMDCSLVNRSLEELPADYRVVVLMYYFEDLSYKEIAEALEIPIGTVMSRLSRAKMHLREKLLPLSDEQEPAEASQPDSPPLARTAPSKSTFPVTSSSLPPIPPELSRVRPY